MKAIKFSLNIKQLPLFYLGFVCIVLGAWLFYMRDADVLHLFAQQSRVMITMMFGAFIAGSSPEGSASIAYPVFTLFLNIMPSDARNFAFAIQSFGMTAATIFILNKGIKLEWKYITFVALSGIPGLLLGTYYLLPLVVPSVAKLIFVSLWLGFGIVLWVQNKEAIENRLEALPRLGKWDKLALILCGFCGGLISSLFGTGINILSYCFMVGYYRLSEKVATPSSVVIMTIETIIGFFLHAMLIEDFSSTSQFMLLACIPMVIFFAPLGAWTIQYIPRRRVAQLLSVVLMLQYVGAMWVLRPAGIRLFYSLCLVLISVVLFALLSQNHRYSKIRV
ncbi:MAG: sulfite exporter TauE/SafE family protein [Saprospiraceae bacterium]|nr:sulfite exporter TauE/SafE family protein [Saprospiraceae bacterium]